MITPLDIAGARQLTSTKSGLICLTLTSRGEEGATLEKNEVNVHNHFIGHAACYSLMLVHGGGGGGGGGGRGGGIGS